MSYEQKTYDNTNKGTLWMEAQERTSQTGEVYFQYTGSINVEGKDFWINAYPKKVTRKDGTEVDVLNLVVKEKKPYGNN
jgi:hypothetical protein